jgi:hypothetical protein
MPLPNSVHNCLLLSREAALRTCGRARIFLNLGTLTTKCPHKTENMYLILPCVLLKKLLLWAKRKGERDRETGELKKNFFLKSGTIIHVSICL